MPIYTCTTNNATLTADSKTELATEIASIHASINHVPSTYINIIFHELPAEGVYADGTTASPILVSGWVREGHPDAETTRLATNVAAAVTRITGVDPKRVLVVTQSSPGALRHRRRTNPARARPGTSLDHRRLTFARLPQGRGVYVTRALAAPSGTRSASVESESRIR